MDTNSWVLWLGIIAVVLHVIEEYAEGWVHWANHEVGPRFGVTFTDSGFFLTNAALVFFALAGAAIGWWAPAVSLAVPALFVVNAVFFHMVPSARGDKLTPGTLSAVFVYLPVAAWMFWAAAEDGVLDFGTVLLAFVLGTAVMYYPLAVAVLASRIGWQEEERPGAAAADAVAAAVAAEAAASVSGKEEGERPAGPGEPVIEVEEEVVETQTIVIEPDPEDDDTRVLDPDPEDPTDRD
jgi:hypothetical protein